ncbi:MAG TPA: Hpt domain-containing protein [Candidatus Acidoferrum sp.]|nr:Hpt domain-containing protein [Candidatus Acidoferrum sp.]
MTEPEPILDLDALLESVGGDRDLLDELAGTFAEEVPGWIATLRTAISSGDSATVYRVAHGVNGAIGYFKAPRVREPAVELEAMGREARLTDASPVLDRLEDGLRALGKFLSSAPWKQ